MYAIRRHIKTHSRILRNPHYEEGPDMEQPVSYHKYGLVQWP